MPYQGNRMPHQDRILHQDRMSHQDRPRQERMPHQDRSRQERMPHQDRMPHLERMPHMDRMPHLDRMPHQDRMPHHGRMPHHHGLPRQPGFQNFRYPPTEAARHPFLSDERLPIPIQSFPCPGNQMSFQENENRFNVLKQFEQSNSSGGFELQNHKFEPPERNVRMPPTDNLVLPVPPFPAAPPDIRPVFRPAPANIQHTGQPAPQSIQPAFQPAPPAIRQVFQPAPPSIPPTLQPALSATRPAFLPAPPAIQPAFQHAPSSIQPPFQHAPPALQPVVQPTPANRTAFQTAPVLQLAFQHAPPAIRPAFQTAPPSDEKINTGSIQSVGNFDTRVTQSSYVHKLQDSMEQFITPESNLKNDSSIVKNIQPLSNYRHVPPPQVNFSNINRLSSSLPNLTTNSTNIPHQPNSSATVPSSTINVLNLVPNVIANTEGNSGMANIRIRPPQPNQMLLNFRHTSVKDDQPILPADVRHPFQTQPPFVQMQKMDKTVITPTMQYPLLSIPSNNTGNNSKTEYKETMAFIVKTWLNSRNSFSTSKPKDKQFMKIHAFKENLKIFVGLIEKLRGLNDSLAEHMEAEKSVWENLIKDVTETKNEVINLQYKLFNPEQTKFITTEQKNRKKKRDRIRRRKKELSEKYVASLSKRIKLNEEIDESLQKQRTKITMEKRAESLKNTAGESLVEVKHKQTEVSKFIGVFNRLQELRDIRKKTAIYQGIFVTEKEDAKFSSQIEQVMKLLLSNAKVYENEERALRELREEEAQEMNRVEKEKRKKLKENRQEQLTQVDPMFPFRLYWLQGEESYAGLVHVRRMWDISVCPSDQPGGTRIPKSFVEPSKPCTKEWGRFLVKVPKVRKRKSDIGISN